MAPPSQFVCYLHINQNVNMLQLAQTAAEGADGFNTKLLGYALPMTAEASSSSRSLGFVRGLNLFTTNGPAPNREQLFNTIEYDDGVYKGTICQHGQLLSPPDDAGVWEVAVVGGTGDFRRVQGYNNPSATSDSAVIRYEVHLFYPTDEQCTTV